MAPRASRVEKLRKRKSISPIASPSKRKATEDIVVPTIENLALTPKVTVKKEDEEAESIPSPDKGPSVLSIISEAVTGKTRGRKKGSGTGEIRKQADQYSTNAATQKSQKRRQMLQQTNPLAAQVERDKGTFRVRVTRELSKWKASPEFAAIPSSDQDAAIAKKRESLKVELAEKIENPDAAADRLVREYIQRHADQVTAELFMKQEAQIAHLKAQQVPDIVSDENNPWYEDDEEDENGWTEEIGGVLYHQGTLAGERDLEQDAIVQLNEKMFGSTDISDLDKLKEIAITRREHRLGEAFSQMIILHEIGPALDGSRNVNPLWRAIAGQAEFPTDQAKTLFQNKITGKDWFSRDMIKALELKWGALKSEWVDLPGPPDLWPSVNAPLPSGQYSAVDLQNIEWYHEAGFSKTMLKRECWETALFYCIFDTTTVVPHEWEKHISLREEDNWAWRFKGIDTRKFDKFVEEAHDIGDVIVRLRELKIARKQRRTAERRTRIVDVMDIDTKLPVVEETSDDEV